MCVCVCVCFNIIYNHLKKSYTFNLYVFFYLDWQAIIHARKIRGDCSSKGRKTDRQIDRHNRLIDNPSSEMLCHGHLTVKYQFICCVEGLHRILYVTGKHLIAH